MDHRVWDIWDLSDCLRHTKPMDIDPIWTTSRTARQIFALGQVEKVAFLSVNSPFFFSEKAFPQDITRLLSLAASSTSLLTLPQTDGPDDRLPQGDERSEQFVLEANEYFVRLDVSVFSIRFLHKSSVPKGYSSCTTIIISPHPSFAYRTISHRCARSQFHPSISGRRPFIRNKWHSTHQSRPSRGEG